MQYEFGDFVLDVGRLKLKKLGEPEIPLAGKTYDGLLFFLEHAGEALDKDTLLAAIWPGAVVEENSLTQLISTLRQVLGETRGELRYIVTLPRKGYRFIAPVRRVTSEVAGPAASAPSPSPSLAAVPAARRWIPMFIAALLVVAALGAWKYRLRPASAPDIQSLAILPFKPLVASERNPALELGMADALIGQLARGNQVISPLSSVRRFDHLDQDSVDAGRQLHVDAVLDGSIQRQGERLRISVRLLRVADGKQLWSESFDQTFTGIFDVQDAIGRRIAAALSSKAPADSSATPGTRNIKAYESYAAGRFAFMRLTEASLLQALDLYKQAITQDANYALAYTGIADCYTLLSVLGLRDPRIELPLARDAVEQAIRLDLNLPAAYASRGQIRAVYDHDSRGALEDLDHAVALDPRYASAYFYRGLVYGVQGQFDRSRAELSVAQRLEPFVLARPAAAALQLLYQRRYDQGITELRGVLALDDRFDLARGFLIRLLLAKGDYVAALNEIKGRQIHAQGAQGFLAEALALSGQQQAARAELDRVLASSRQQYVPAYDIAMIYAAMRDTENTLLWIGRAYEDRSTLMGAMGLEPLLDFLRDDPRFIDYVRRNEMPRGT
jgi:DNA-binding winged helix-turn-helix (wHTH) protein/TolB-like protein/tetratricopeptide (TPR) repeat protein